MTSSKDQIEKIKHLISLFEARDKLYQQTTEEILELVGPTALDALFTLFDAPMEQVRWLETHLVENIMLLVASITYDDDQEVPPVIQALSPNPEEGGPSIRLFRVGIPLTMLFQPKEDIVDYLTETAGKAARLRGHSTPVGNLPPEGTLSHAAELKAHIQESQQDEDTSVPVHGPQPDFDTSDLTYDQIQQLLMFESLTKGIKH